MTTRLAAAWTRWMHGVVMVALSVLLAGCATKSEIVDAITALNEYYRTEYEAALKENGTRVFKLPRAEVYDALRVSLARLGLTVEAQDPVIGYLRVFGPSPRPLDAEEWRRVSDTDLPRTREIIGPHVGLMGHFFNFEPEGLQTVITGTVVETPSGTTVSFTARMREITPPKSGFPRRSYLPPTAVRMGLDKMWQELQREFDATYRRR